MSQESDNTQARSPDVLDKDVMDKEALSALMDNELGDFELRRLLRSIEHQPDLLAVWERYSLTRAALRSEPMCSPAYTQSRTDFSTRIMEALASEPPMSKQGAAQVSEQNFDVQVTDKKEFTHQSSTFKVRQHLAKFAVAASVTVAVFLGMQTLLQEQGLPAPGLADQQSSPGMSGLRQQIAVDTEAQQRLNDYIRSVSIPARVEAQSAPFNVLLESPQLRPVSDRELIELIERE